MNILGQMREHMSTTRIKKLWWIDTRDMIADGLNKGAVSRKALLLSLTKGLWHLEHPTVSMESNNLSYSDNIVDTHGTEID